MGPEQRVELDATWAKLFEALHLLNPDAFEAVHRMLAAQAETLGTRGGAKLSVLLPQKSNVWENRKIIG